MSWARAGASSLLSLVVIAGTASAEVIDSEGRYEVTVVVAPEITPPGLPPLGPNAYPGELTLQETGSGWNASFRGETDSGDQLHIQAKFDSGWSGIETTTVPIDGQVITNAVFVIHVADLESANINGVGLVNGVESRVHAKIGPGGTVEQVHIN